jgi:hypothetical protein
MTKGIIKARVGVVLVSAVLGISFQSFAQQPGAQPPIAESLSYIAQLFVKQTVVKFDSVLIQNRLATGKITNSSLDFRLETGETSSLKTSEIAALMFDQARAKVVLQSGERLSGQLLTDVEIALVGADNPKIKFSKEFLHNGLGMIVLNGQLQNLSSEEFQELLTRFLKLVTRADIIVFQNDSILAGLVTNQIFQIDEFYFNKSEIAEIIFGPPCQLRATSGQVMVGTMRTPAVTVELLSEQARFEFATQTLARILFRDRMVTFSKIASIVERLIPGDEGQNPRGGRP